MACNLFIENAKYPGINFDYIRITVPLNHADAWVKLVEFDEIEIGQEDLFVPVKYANEYNLTLFIEDRTFLWDVYESLTQTGTDAVLYFTVNGVAKGLMSYATEPEGIEIDVVKRTLSLCFFEKPSYLTAGIMQYYTIYPLDRAVLFPWKGSEDPGYIVNKKTQVSFRTIDNQDVGIEEIFIQTRPAWDPTFPDTKLETFADSVNALLNCICSYLVMDYYGCITVMPNYFDSDIPVYQIQGDVILDDSLEYEIIPGKKGIEFRIGSRITGSMGYQYYTADYGEVVRNDAGGDLKNPQDVQTIDLPYLIGDVAPYIPGLTLTDAYFVGAIQCSAGVFYSNQSTPTTPEYNITGIRMKKNGSWMAYDSILGMFIQNVAPLLMQNRLTVRITCHGIDEWRFDRYYTIPNDSRIYSLRQARFNPVGNKTELYLIQMN